MILKGLSAAVGGIVSATAAAACCAPPILAGIMGTGMSGLGGQLEPYRPAFLAASGAFFLLGFTWVRRREHACAEDGECDTCERTGAARWILIVGLIASVLMASYPTWGSWL